MQPERWKQVDDVLQSALDRAPHQRDAFLQQACAGISSIFWKDANPAPRSSRKPGHPSERLFVFQRHHWIDMHGPASGDVAGGERDEGQ
jgi:hypothetical protein